jgi:hypothetical protein
VLLFDAVDDVCSSGASGGKLSNDAGDAWVEARWCGQAKVVVAARGYSPVTHALDSCDTHAVVIDLTGFPPEPPAASDPAAITGREFITALLARDTIAIERRLADPNTASLYLTGGVTNRPPPDAIRFAGMRSGGERSVQFDLYYATGCRESWLVHLVGEANSLRVAEVAMGVLR